MAKPPTSRIRNPRRPRRPDARPRPRRRDGADRARDHVRAARARQALALRLLAQRQPHPRGARGLPRRARRRRAPRFAFGSGCAAATTLLHTLRPGDHVVCGDDVYGGTFRIFTSRDAAARHRGQLRRPARRWRRSEAALTPTHAHGLARDADQSACSGSSTSRPSPTLARGARHRAGRRQHVRHARAAAAARSRRDRRRSTRRPSTSTATPTWSAARWSRATTSSRSGCRFLQNAIGAVPSPFDCYLVLRGIKTLPRAHAAPRRDGARAWRGVSSSARGRARACTIPASPATRSTPWPRADEAAAAA